QIPMMRTWNTTSTNKLKACSLRNAQSKKSRLLSVSPTLFHFIFICLLFFVYLGLINPAAMGNSHTAIDKLELAKRRASQINLTKNISLDTKFATQQAAESILKGSSSQLL